MSDMVIPTGWVKHRIGNDSVTWARSGHSASLPDIVIFKATNAGGTSKYQVKGVKGFDSDTSTAGIQAQNVIVELNVRNVEGSTDSDVTTLINDLADLMTTTGFQDDVIALSLPLDGNQV